MRPPALVSVLVVTAGFAGCLPGGSGRPGLAAYNIDENGLALKGYSPVSYLDDARAEPGSPAHSMTWRGITYRFTDEAQREKFAEDAERYEPACGGWCAYGISVGIRWDPDPENFEIIDGRVYLFSRNGDADARELWDREKDREALLERVDRYWHSLLEE